MSALPSLSCDLDRAAERREDPAWLERALQSGARLVPVWRGRSLVDAAGAHAIYPPAGGVATGDEPILLGVARDGSALLGLALAGDGDEAQALAGAGAESGAARFADLRALRATLAAPDAAILGYARALVHWHAVTGFCGGCGAPTRPISAGHVRLCTNPDDGARHFPRTDPAVIMLVHDVDRILLGRQKEWPAGMYSALAGFVEPGETLEATVEREVREESGIDVADVRYFASQPWPFPQSLMVGFFARATSIDIVRGDELDDVRWFSREETADLERGAALSLPGVDTIARRLIGAWQRGEHDGASSPLR